MKTFIRLVRLTPQSTSSFFLISLPPPPNFSPAAVAQITRLGNLAGSPVSRGKIISIVPCCAYVTLLNPSSSSSAGAAVIKWPLASGTAGEFARALGAPWGLSVPTVARARVKTGIQTEAKRNSLAIFKHWWWRLDVRKHIGWSVSRVIQALGGFWDGWWKLITPRDPGCGPVHSTVAAWRNGDQRV